jgi:hypothetical protein
MTANYQKLKTLIGQVRAATAVEELEGGGVSYEPL